MNSKFSILVLVAMLSDFSPVALRAQDAPSSTETRLREALRSTSAQLDDSRNQVITLQATQAQSDKDNADLKAKVEALTAQVAALIKQSDDDKAASTKAIADNNAQIADQAGQIARLNQALGEWKGAYNKLVALATAKEDARAKLAYQAAVLQRTVDDREAKNVALYNTGSEILTRYEKFGLGDALGAKEPFVGLSRVKLENLVQGYKDKLLGQTVTPGQPPAAVPTSAPRARPTEQASRTSAPSGSPPART